MKKILLLVLCCMFISSTCLASISTKDDEFTGGKIISSWNMGEHKFGHISSYSFNKILAGSNISYSVELNAFVPEGGRVISQDILMNIDGKTYNLIIAERERPGEIFCVIERCVCNLNNEMVNDLKKANRVAFKLSVKSPSYGGSIPSTYEGISVISQKALDEWKLVIDMTEPPKKK